MSATKEQNSRKRQFSMLEAIFSWTVLGFIIALLVGAGFAVLSMAPPRHRIAEACFSIAALVFWAKFAYWAVTSEDNLTQRVFVSLVVFGISGALLIWGLSWVEGMLPQPEVSTPFNLRGTILHIGIGYNPEFKAAGGVLVANVTNTGVPVSVDPDAWRIKARLTDGRVVEGKLSVNWTTLNFSMESGGVVETYTKDKDLLQQGVREPIPTNGQIFGVTPFVIPDVPKEALAQKGVALILEYKDVLGHPYSAEHVMSGVNAGPRDYIPGIGGVKPTPTP
jgi:hypothetical protein